MGLPVGLVSLHMYCPDSVLRGQPRQRVSGRRLVLYGAVENQVVPGLSFTREFSAASLAWCLTLVTVWPVNTYTSSGVSFFALFSSVRASAGVAAGRYRPCAFLAVGSVTRRSLLCCCAKRLWDVSLTRFIRRVSEHGAPLDEPNEVKGE